MRNLTLASLLFSILAFSSILVSAGVPVVAVPFETSIDYGCSATTVTTTSIFIEKELRHSIPNQVMAMLGNQQKMKPSNTDVNGATIIIIPLGGIKVSIDVNNGAYVDSQSFLSYNTTSNFVYPAQTGLVPITVTITPNFVEDASNFSSQSEFMSVDTPVDGKREEPPMLVFKTVLDCNEGGIPSKCPDNRLNGNLCEPIAIYAAIDDDGSYFITVYQSAPEAEIGKLLFELTSDEIAAASAGEIIDSASNGFAKAYLDGAGNIIFEAGPDFEGKIFYFSFPLDSFPYSYPNVSTSY